MSKLSQLNNDDSTDTRPRTHSEGGFLVNEWCRPQPEETPNRVIITSEGVFPFRPNMSDPAVRHIKAAAADRSVPITVDGGDVHYDAQADDYKLADKDVRLGMRVQWDGSAYDEMASDPGAINFVAQSNGDLVLTSLRPEQRTIGRGGFGAHGLTLVQNLVKAIANGQSDKAAEILEFTDLAFGDDVYVNYETEAFMSATNNSKVSFLANQIRRRLSKKLGVEIKASEWMEMARPETSGEGEGEGEKDEAEANDNANA